MEIDPEAEKRFERDDRVSKKAQRLLFLQLAVLASVGILHRVGFALYLYWVFWWYDILVHVLAGTWVALFTYWVAILCGWKREWAPVLLVVLVAGITWEFFESSIGTPYPANFYMDTAIDLTCDIVGGIIGFIASRRVESVLEMKSNVVS